MESQQLRSSNIANNTWLRDCSKKLEENRVVCSRGEMLSSK
jgi:hypothetical protein